MLESEDLKDLFKKRRELENKLFHVNQHIDEVINKLQKGDLK